MILLTTLNESDEQVILSWLNNPEICWFNSHGTFPVTEPIKPDRNTLRLGIRRISDWRLIGVIALQKIDWVNRSAELAILIGDKAIHRKGVGKQACEDICRQGFYYLNLHRIYCGTHEKNIGMQKVAEHLGMTLEGRTREAFYKHGDYADILHYGILKSEFEARFHANRSHIERATDLPADHPDGSQGPPQG